MAEKLARVRWEMGQTLLPEHFRAQEEALITDTTLRFRTRGLPGYGIAELKWNDTLLREGILMAHSMTVILPSGLMLNVPGNAGVSSFNLNVPGMVSLPVYLHVVNPLSQDNGGDGQNATGEDPIVRVVYQLILSSDQAYPGALETMKIAEFIKDPQGVWQQSGSFIPPLLQAGTSPYLRSEFAELTHLLELFHYKLTQEVAASYLSGEGLFSAKQCLKAVYHIERFLANVCGQIHIHPYYVYEALKTFYTEVCFFRNTTPQNTADPYNHDQLAPCFQKILEPLKEQMQLVQARSPYRPFELKDGMYRITFPPELRQAKEIYFLIQKDHVNMKISIEDLKLASLSRLSLVHRLALQGIPLKKIDRPPFQHSFGPEVDFYLAAYGEEMDYAIRELSVAFYHQDQFKEMNFYFYWRLE
ncbi:MAG: type VI secretion system baseplate subunit TssK [bacterium]